MNHLASTILGTLFTVQLFFSLFSGVRAADVTITGTVAPGIVASFDVVAAASAVAGEPFTVTITARDANGLITTNVPQDLTVSTTNGGVITPLTISASEFTDDGVWVGQMTLSQSGTARTIIVQSGAATGQTTIDILPPSTAPPPPPASVIDQVGEIVTRIGEALRQVRQVLRQNPIARQVAETLAPIFAPIATATGALTTIAQVATAVPALTSLSNLLLYTSYLWSALLEVLGLKRRRRPWGVVYNAKTKAPIPLVVVQLVDEETGHPVEQRVTDPYGRFGFLPKPGRYRIQPGHPQFAFPSKISPEKGDLRYTDLYHGEVITISDPDTVLAANIPMDPVAEEAAEGSSVLRTFSFRRVSMLVMWLALFLQGFTVYLFPTPRNLVLFSIYLIIITMIYFFFRRRKRAWGVVYDAQTKKELANAQIFVTQEEDTRFASRKVTDELGRFYLLLPTGTYRLAVQHPGYVFPGPQESLGYKGEAISVTPKHPLLHVDIPVGKAEGQGADNATAPGVGLQRAI
jgi:hypothetical protein